MTLRQRILKRLYPIFMKLSRSSEKNGIVLKNTESKSPAVPFYSLKAKDISGKEVSFEQYRGKKVMVVNVASDCGYTGQYEALEKLYEENQKNLVVLGFPADNFGGQEPGNDSEIAEFCKKNFGVSFPLFQKSSVLKPDQNEVFQWLSDKSKNGWNSKRPVWNFSKYIVDEKGNLSSFLGPAVAPDSEEVLEEIKG